MKPPFLARTWWVTLGAFTCLGLATVSFAGLHLRGSRNANATPNLDGQWLLDHEARSGVHLTLKVELEPGSQHWRSGPLDWERVEGLAEADVAEPSRDVTFRLRRDAGTFVCEGRVGRGRGAGVFRLELAPDFASELRRRGVGTPTPYQQAELAMGDASFALIDELTRRRAEFDVDDLVTMSNHGVDLAYVRGMAAHGIAPGDVEELLRLRDHGVDPEFIEGMAALGYRDLGVDELVRARDHGATPEYARTLEKAGFGRLSLEELVRARDHGVSGDYVVAMAAAGYGKLPLERLIEARDHGVTVEYIDAMERAGFGALPLERLIAARDHGVDANYLATMAKAGYADADLAMLIRARDHGVDAAFARRARAALGRTPSLERLIQMRDRGDLDG